MDLGDFITYLFSNVQFGAYDLSPEIQLDYNRCRRCHADLHRDLKRDRTHCSGCNKKIKRWQIRKWRFYHRR